LASSTLHDVLFAPWQITYQTTTRFTSPGLNGKIHEIRTLTMLLVYHAMLISKEGSIVGVPYGP
jgi:hypothetical protein